MKKNIGSTDQMIRISFAVLITVLYITNLISGNLEIALLLALGVLIVTSFFNFCPFYFLTGITSKKKSKYR